MGAAVHPAAGRCSRPCRHAVGDRWQVDETYVKVAGRWRSVCQQPHRGRPRLSQGAAAADARAQAGPQHQNDRRWACIHAEPSTRTLRAGDRGASEPASGRGDRRTGLDDLTPEEATASARPASGQRTSALPNITPHGQRSQIVRRARTTAQRPAVIGRGQVWAQALSAT